MRSIYLNVYIFSMFLKLFIIVLYLEKVSYLFDTILLFS